ncbi:hypothetical protein Ddc_21407 [Ditylenchus destructor]|nr:hypothetical protein Ddc_21407 [Ditylenchus destructor]
MSIVKFIFLLQLLSIAICGFESRECVGDGTYVDFPREEARKAESGGRHCSDIPHNLKMFEDEDTPDSACKHKYCPSCILVLREYCLPLDDKNFCQPLRAQLKHRVCPGFESDENRPCHQEELPDETEKVCKAIGAHCDGLCGDVIKQIGNATILIDERRATPYKICKAFNLC